MISLKKEFVIKFADIMVRVITPGRVMQIVLQTYMDKVALCFIYVHIDPNLSDGEKQNIWRRVHALTDRSIMISFILGDYNMVDHTEGRFYPRTNNTTFGDQSMSKWFHQLFSHYTELAQ